MAKPLVFSQRFTGRRLSRALASSFLLLVLLGFATLLVTDLLASREREYDAVRRDSDNLSRVIERGVLTAVEKIDVVLSETAHQFGPVVNDGKPRDRLEANLDLQRWMNFIPEAQRDSLRVINREGRVVYNASASAELPNVVVTDRGYFQRQRDDPAAGLVLSEPLLSRFTGNWLITLSRPMQRADGQFGGLVQAALRTEYFQSLFETLEVGADANISLFDTDLRLLSRHPAIPEQLGKQFDNTDVRAGLAENRATGSYEAVSRVDGVKRLFVYRKLANFPYVVVIGRAPDEFLYSWRVKAYLYALGFAGLALSMLSFLVVFLRHTQENRQLVSKVFETSREGIVVTDVQGRIVTANNAFSEITGYQVAEVIGRTNDFLKSGRHDADFFQAMWTALQTQGIWRGEVWNRRKNGDIFLELLSINALRDRNGATTNYIGVFSDITELYNAQQQAEAANHVKSEFLATMSHEIRTPMNGIIGMTGLLMDTPLTVEQRHLANTTRVSAEALLSIINDILDFSKIEAGRLDFEECPFDVPSLVEGVVDILMPRAVTKKLEVSVYVAPELAGEFRGDPGRIRQVLMNLAGNAMKFTEHGSVSIRATRVDDEHGEHLHLAVLDTGVGIVEAAKPRLFTMFTQADASTARKFGGSGLGLAISRRIVEMMGGEIGFDSVTGQGSRFWFTVPLSRISESSPDHEVATFLRGLRVLVIDDTPTNLEVFRRQLEGWGVRVVEAATAIDGLGLLRRAQADGAAFDAAILDHHMPQMTGIDLARVVRADPKLAGTRLILASSGQEGDEDPRVAAIGWAALLVKPIRPSVLMDCLASAVGHKSLSSSAMVMPPAEAPRPADMPFLRLLVAEDNAINQQVAVGLLTRLGHRADVANDGGEAVVLVERGDYDLVFMDVQMPGMDGIEATKAIRAFSGPKASVPIVAMTANAMAGDREAFLAAGMDDYISKPISRRGLEALLKNWSNRLARTGAPQPEPQPTADVPSTELRDAAAQAELAEELGQARFDGLVRKLFDGLPGQLAAMDAAVAATDASALAKVAHNLKGSSANLGFIGLAQAAFDLEQAAKKDGDGLAALLIGLRRRYEESLAVTS
ncbi:MAG TPA: response regulator [Patescibacteria group bacterium]|nr:response regulator [Patescibacteria group bacterium]